MPRLLLISADPAALDAWDLPGFMARVLPPGADLAAGANESEVVVFADTPAIELRRLLAAMKEARGVRPIPAMLAAPPEGPDLVKRLRLEGIDGLLDPAWPAALRARCLEITVEHVKIGQQVVEIQRYLLKAARREAKLLHDQTIRDGLTGLYNRRHYEDVVRRELSRAERFDQPLSLVFMDFDHLKQINSGYGHRAGSAALEQMGEAIGHSVRAVDLPFRFGGDEFVILLPDTDREGALECAERVRRHLSSTEVRLEHETFRVTASFGVAVYPEDGQTIDTLLQRADDALFQAKYRGRNCVVMASADPAG